MKTILITGASSGIGAALAEFYADKNHRLALTGRDAVRLNKVAEICRQKGAIVDTLQCDILAQDILHQWIVSIDKRFEIDLVIANAGISAGTAGLPPKEISSQSRHIFDVNVTGVLNTIEPVLPRMIARKCGQIALMSSMAGFLALPGAPAYSASKAAIRFYGEALRANLIQHGLKISVICPGFIQTPLTAVNTFPMPFAISAKQAAKHIAKGLDANHRLIKFPFVFFFFVTTLSLIPKVVLNPFLSFLPRKAH